MSTAYNIYRMYKNELNKLELSLKENGLIKQKTIENIELTSTFYFSEKNTGNDVWWWETYRDFIDDNKKKPKNIFHYGLLVSIPKIETPYVYLVSLGKSHFYLSKYIDKEFGMNLAIRMADENTVLLKKSSYLSSIKKSDISSYEKFIVDSYEPGESVDHLKLKAKDKETWGDKNIIFSDSIQLNSDSSPKNIDKILSKIIDAMSHDSHISLPRYKVIVNKDKVAELDKLLLNEIISSKVQISITEFESSGDSIFFINECHSHELYTRKGQEKYANRENNDCPPDKDILIKYIKGLARDIKINDIKISLNYDNSTPRKTTLKDLMEVSVNTDNTDFFLRKGTWCTFNETFKDYLKKSLEKITTEKKDDLIENDFIIWRTNKEKDISDGNSSNKITYREYYFNTLMAKKHSYELWDRQNEKIESIINGNKDYKVEIADLYKNNEIISVKISDDTNQLIYNIQQSITSFELYQKGELSNKKINTVSLWFVFTRKIEITTKITCINSIQFLLAIEHWKKRVESYGFQPKIYISEHVDKL